MKSLTILRIFAVGMTMLGAVSNCWSVDIVWRHSNGADGVWFMNGTAFTGSCGIMPVYDSGWTIGASRDFNGDGQPDLVWRSYSGVDAGKSAIWTMNRIGFTGSVYLPFEGDTNWRIEGAGDFNGDGNSDILWHHHGTGQFVIWFMNGLSYVSSTVFATIADDLNWHIAGTGDFNHDGQTDILLREAATGQNVVWLMSGSSISSGQFITSVTDTAWVIGGAADANSDGNVDIYWRHTGTGENAVWLMNQLTLSSGVSLRPEYDLGWQMRGVGDFTAFATPASFVADNRQASGSSQPPDTSGAIGPTHFMSLVNDSGGISVYNRANPPQLITRLNINTFFQFADGSMPRGGCFDPRILYDHRSQRWFLCAIENEGPSGTFRLNNDMVVAISQNSDPIGTTVPGGQQAGWHTNANRWIKLRFTVAETNLFTDFPTLGVDDHGVYVGLNFFSSETGGFQHSSISTIAKTTVTAAQTGQTFTPAKRLQASQYHPQPALNYDTLGASDPAWFIAGQAGGGVYCANITWSGTTPSDNLSWTSVSTPASGSPSGAPQPNPNYLLDSARTGGALENAFIRGIYLWTSHTVGVNVNGGATSPDRSGCEWLKFQLPASSTSALIYLDYGRVYDATAQNPWWFFLPSITTNSRGDAVLGFSGSSSASDGYLSAFFAGRYGTSPAGITSSALLLHRGDASFLINSARVGDYSQTSLDPNGLLTCWTIQEVADNSGFGLDPWGVWAASVQTR